MIVITHLVSFFFLAEFISNIAASDSNNITRRYEYLCSFKPPMLAQANGEIPFFEHGGHAIASTDSIRLTPSMVNKKGWVWSKQKANFPAFDAEFSFRVTGRGRIGADGLAFWFVSEKSQGGSVYGAADKWTGLGLFFDTYDNDGGRNNPIVMAIINDGTKQYLHDSDGEGQQAGHCIRDFRNRPVPIRVKVHYFMNTLEVYVGHGMVEKDQDIDLCFVAHDVKLPSEGYFGFSAATGDLADDHDVYRLEVHSLRVPSDSNAKSTIPEPSSEFRDKLEKEFVEYTDKLKKAEEEFQKQQASKPVKDRKGKKSRKPEDAYAEEETESNRNLRQIWEAQSTLMQMSKEASQKLTSFSEQFGKLATLYDSAGKLQLPEDLLKRNDLITSVAGLQSILANVKTQVDDVKSIVSKLNEPKLQVDTKYDQLKWHDELRDMINDLGEKQSKSDKQMEERLREMLRLEFTRVSNAITRDCGSCLSMQIFLLILVAQTIFLVGFLLYQHNKANSVKKFY